MKRKLTYGLVVVTVVIIAFFLKAFDFPQSQEEASAAPHLTNGEKRLLSLELSQQASLALRFDQGAAKLANNPLDRASFSEDMLIIDDPTSTNEQVMTSLHSLLSTVKYLSQGKSYPSGLNVEVTNSLLGLNSRKVGYIPEDSIRLNEYGELIDTFGSPYWFHTSAQGHLKVVSAGPDRLMHTADDVTFPSER